MRVIETDVPSKANALNLGDAAASGFPRFYVDADVALTADAVRKVAAAIGKNGVLAAAPRPVDVFLPGTSWAVRAYYRFWAELPYIQEGMIAAGVYALGAEGRARFADFPAVIADDGYVRLQFAPHERVMVGDAPCEVSAPVTLNDLVKIRTRSRLGVLQLHQRYPELANREAKTKNYGGALGVILRRPSLYLSAIPYVYVAVASLLRARRQAKRLDRYVWERDDSSRQAPAAGSAS